MTDQRVPALQEPANVTLWLQRGVAVLAAALAGMGVVMWIAANWDTLGRIGHFALLQALVAACAMGAAVSTKARAPLGLLSLLGIGSLFAYFGQTYQTGADPWQLFAVWAVLALPLCWGARSDVLWAPWALVMVTGISLWTHTYTGNRWAVQEGQLQVHFIAWSASLALAVGLSPALARYTGAGPWSFRTAVALSVMAITLTALGGLFHNQLQPQYLLGLLVFAVGAALLNRQGWFDVFAISAVALGINTLVVCGAGRVLLQGSSDRNWIGSLLLLGVLAAGLLAASVSGIAKLSHQHAAPGDAS